MADVDGYEEDARRIEDDYVDPSSTDSSEIASDLSDAGFANPEEVADWILERDDVDLDPSSAHQNGVTTRETVEREVADADVVGYSDRRRGEISEEISSEIGAPTESELQEATLSSVTSGEQVGSNSTPSSIIRSQSGEAVAIVGGSSSSKEAAQEVAPDAAQYDSPQEFSDSMSVRPGPNGDRGVLYLNEQPINEVNL